MQQRAIILVCVSLSAVADLRAADPIMGYGLTNFAIGQALVRADEYYGMYRVEQLRSNGLDGISILLGEPDSGVFLTPTVGYLEDGNWMVAKAYGQLNGSNDSLLATIRGGRASTQLYPLTLDFSPLGPQSVTYQVFFDKVLQREFTRGTPMVVVNWGNVVYPTVSPIGRGRDGALGTSLTMSWPVSFVFPEALASAYGDELFIRLNNPTNQPGIVSRVDVFGGGNLNDFAFNDVALGVFGRPHQSIFGATLDATPSRLRIGKLINTNEIPGIFVKLDRAAALTMEFEPFQLADSNHVVMVNPSGSIAGNIYNVLGTFSMYQTNESLVIALQQDLAEDMHIAVLTNGSVLSVTNVSSTDVVNVNANAFIGSITAHAKTVDHLPGFHVQFTQPTPITVAGSSVTGDEVRLLMPFPARMEYLQGLHLGIRGPGAITITNEIAPPADLAGRLQIVRSGDEVILTWPNPNRLLAVNANYWGFPGYYSSLTNPIIFTDPYSSVAVPINKTNPLTYFRLFYNPDD